MLVLNLKNYYYTIKAITMKKILIIAAIFSLSFSAFAQEPDRREMPSPENRAERMTARMTEELGLTEEQQKEVYRIHLKNAKQRQTEMDQRKAELEAKKAEMKANQELHEKEIAALLSPEQKNKWAELKAERTERSNGYRQNGSERDRKGESFRGGRSGPKRTLK
jgi:periplasmic protein CpxP/Spy